MTKREENTKILECLYITLRENGTVTRWQELLRKNGLDVSLDRMKDVYEAALRKGISVSWPKCGKQSHFRENLRKSTPQSGYVCRTI